MHNSPTQEPDNKETSKVLARSTDYLITYHSAPEPASRKLIISFGIRESGLIKKGFGTDFSIKSKFDTIYVAQRRNSFYQGLSISAFVDAVAPFVYGRQVFTYGASLGAYCALYYGGAINAQIVASAPRNSAHPSVRQRSTSDIPFLHSNLCEVPISAYPPIVLYDPFHTQDKKFIEEWVMPAYPNAILKNFPHAGHSIIEAMHKSKVLKRFVLSIWQDGVVLDVKLQKDGCHIWHRERGSYYRAKKDFLRAKEDFKASLNIQVNGIALNGLMQIYINSKNIPEIINLIKFVREQKSLGLISPHINKRLLELGMDLV